MRERKVKRLKERCIEILVRNFDDFLDSWNKETNIPVKECIQRNFCNDFYKVLPKPMLKKHAAFLINPNLHTLELHKFSLADGDDVMRMLRSNGQGVLKVEIQEPSYEGYSKYTLQRLIGFLPASLKYLSLLRTKCCDNILQNVVRNCPNLQELVLSSCQEITDDGIKAVFFNGYNSINNTLQNISLEFTSVTIDGIVFLLDNCPNITDICHNEVEDAISYICTRHIENNDLRFRENNLQSLNLDGKLVEAAKMLCPNVKRIIINDISSQMQVNDCINFKHLTNVHFDFVKSFSLTPFFVSRGSALQKLAFSGNVTVPIDLLIQLCPRIHRLRLHCVNFEMGQHFNSSRFSLHNLEELEIDNVDFEAETRYINTLLVCSPKLEIFSVSYVSRFNYAFVQALTERSVPALENLEISVSDVDVKTIRKFITIAPNLKHISFDHCTNIPHIAYKRLEQLRSGLHINSSNPFHYI